MRISHPTDMSPRRVQHGRRFAGRSALTMIELLLAVGLMAIVSTVAFLSYDAAVRAWRVGQELSNSLHQGDFIMEQLVMGLRSSYWCANHPGYGFQLHHEGEGSEARDSISWVKLGTSLVGSDTIYAGMPHAVEVSVRDDVPDAQGKTATGLAVRSWRLDLQANDFDASKVPPVILTTRVVGFSCRVLDTDQPKATGLEKKPELKWTDQWTATNTLPTAVKLTLYVQSPEKGKDPIEMNRIVQLPLSNLSQGK